MCAMYISNQSPVKKLTDFFVGRPWWKLSKKQHIFTHLQTWINGHFGRILLTTSPKVAIYLPTPRTNGFLVLFVALSRPDFINLRSSKGKKTWDVFSGQDATTVFSLTWRFWWSFLHRPFNPEVKSHPIIKKKVLTKSFLSLKGDVRAGGSCSIISLKNKNQFLWLRKFQLARHNAPGGKEHNSAKLNHRNLVEWLMTSSNLIYHCGLSTNWW